MVRPIDVQCDLVLEIFYIAYHLSGCHGSIKVVVVVGVGEIQHHHHSSSLNMATTSEETITIGIAGLTGKFARLVASFLLEKPNARIRGYVRDPTKLDSSLASDPRVEVIQGEAFDTTKSRTFVHGCDVVICAYLGDNKLMIEGQKILVDACEAENVPRYIASDYCLDFTKLEKGQLFPKDPMIEVKEYLDGKKIVKGVHVLIGAFMDTFFSPYFQVWDPESKKLKVWGSEDLVWEMTSYKTAAEYVAAVAVDTKAAGVLKCKHLQSVQSHSRS